MDITGKTAITGVFGCPVAHSLSPVFQNAAFAHCGIDCVYIPFEVPPDNLDEAVRGLRALNFTGINLTIPHKQNVIGLIDELDAEAELLGAVNTVVNNRGLLKGYITDGRGFVESLKEDGNFNPAARNVFIFGAGGSAYAISGALANCGVKKIMVCNRTYEKAVQLKRHLEEKSNFRRVEVAPFGERNKKELWEEQDIVINTTSIGMKQGDPVLLDPCNMGSVKFVYDIVYNRESLLISSAKRLRKPFLDGISMLVYQGALSFELWTGERAPVDVMKKSLEPFTLSL